MRLAPLTVRSYLTSNSILILVFLSRSVNVCGERKAQMKPTESEVQESNR